MRRIGKTAGRILAAVLSAVLCFPGLPVSAAEVQEDVYGISSDADGSGVYADSVCETWDDEYAETADEAFKMGLDAGDLCIFGSLYLAGDMLKRWQDAALG
ncbi:MAG: hypothetical protein HUJ73_05360 [Eubacterium sp.]|nr:hypothetical protein [Eubacterium sp.]